MATTEYTITGMTCGNCENHVRSEVEGIAGARVASVSATTGLLAVETNDAPVDDVAVLAAVKEAGYSATRA